MFGRKNETKPELELYTVYDSVSQTYDVPAFSPNRHVLIRDVVNMLKDPAQAKNKYVTNAEDYTIFLIGSFDKTSGEIKGQSLERVAYMHELKSLAFREEGPGALSAT